MSSGILMLCVNYFFETDSWTQSSWQRYGLLGHTKFIKALREFLSLICTVGLGPKNWKLSERKWEKKEVDF